MSDRPFRILGVNHAGLAPKDVSQSRLFFSTLLGLPHVGDEHVTSQKTLTMMYASSSQAEVPGVDVPQTRLELLADDGAGDGPIAKFLEKKGSGIHHLALSVDRVDAAITWLVSKGVRMIDQTARSGAHNTRIAFIHPEATGGLLIELVEESPSEGRLGT